MKAMSVGGAALTIHAGAEFSRNYFAASRDDVGRLLLEAAKPWLGGKVTASQLHRWKYARPVAATGPQCLFSHEPAQLLFAGDGFGGPRLEGAFLSGLAAEKIVEYGA